MSNYIETRLDGDWDVYLEKLEKVKKSLENIQKHGKGAALKLKGRRVTLRGKKLSDYIQFSVERIDTVRCLAENAENAEMASLENFSTAAGGLPQNDSPDFPAPSKSKKCARIPQVAWWKFKSHEGVIGFVSRSYRNNWKNYIGHWNERLAKLQDIKGRGKFAITSTGIKLGGPDLDSYIDKMQKRISVIKCLALKLGGSNA